MKEKSPSAKDRVAFINTAKEEVILAVFEGTEIISRVTFPGRPDLSKNLSPKFEALLKKSKTKIGDIRAILVFPGPGSFTGLRIGISFANALAFGLSVPVFIADEEGRIKKGPKRVVTPLYGAPPRITKPKKR